MGAEELDFLKQYRRFVHYWWLLVLVMVSGGIAGWVFHRLKPPVYEAIAPIQITVDFNQTGNITPYNLDQAVGVVKAIYYSEAVLQQVVREAQIAGIPINVDHLLDSVTLERMGETWNLRVRQVNAHNAALLAELWRKAGFSALQEAHAHAVSAAELQRYLRLLANCPPPPAFSASVPPICKDSYTIDADAIAVIEEQIASELAQSKAVNAALVFGMDEDVVTPSLPVMYDVNWLVLAGMVIGFGFYLVIVQVLPGLTRDGKHEA